MRHPGSGRYPQKGWTMTTEKTDAVGPGRGGRMSRQRKRDAVLRLLRGEDLETVSRALGVTAATLTTWRDSFLAAGEAAHHAARGLSVRHDHGSQYMSDAFQREL